jgi:hypothetical protein
VEEAVYEEVSPYSTRESEFSFVVQVIVDVLVPGVPELTEDITGPVLSIYNAIVEVA